jgi:hypothetical protein
METMSFFSNRSARAANTHEPRTQPQIKLPSFSIIPMECRKKEKPIPAQGRTSERMHKTFWSIVRFLIGKISAIFITLSL